MWMHERGVDDKSLFDALRTDMLMKRVTAALVEKVRPTDAQVQEYYKAHKEDLKTPGEVRLRIIAVKDKAAAQEIVAALQRGESFRRLARERSIGLRAAKGGDTGWVAVETLQPPLRQAVDALKVGEANGPLPRDAEFLIVGLAARRPGRTKTLDEARPEIEQRLLPAKQQEAVQAWLKEQEAKSKIEVLL
jgi:parvulin-like peptidyl-prolyl isomerase